MAVVFDGSVAPGTEATSGPGRAPHSALPGQPGRAVGFPANRPRAALTAGAMAQEGESPMQRVDIPRGYCQCGCGKKTGIATRSSTRDGYKKGEPFRFLPKHNSRAPFMPDYVEQDCGFTTPCWVWQKSLDRGGYGQRTVRSGTRAAHRQYYERANGLIPKGLQLDHLCRNRRCVNPDHLEVVPSALNTRRGLLTKLTQAEVDAIRVSPARHRDLADVYGVDESTIRRIRSFARWKPLAA